MTGDELAFLAAIRANPADDTPRLVYADWLDENAVSAPCRACESRHLIVDIDTLECAACGGTGAISDGRAERAEFIRVQCELAAKYPAHPAGQYADPAYWNLCDRERGLWTGTAARTWGCGDGWRHTLHRLTMAAEYGASTPAALFRRGFVAEVTCTAKQWLAHERALHWHPGATDECPACEGKTGAFKYSADDTTNRLMHGEQWYTCLTCIGTGRQPRPCPPTARPIERVSLTTHLGPEYGFTRSDREPDDPAGWACDHWPGIEFVLPPPVTERPQG